MQSKTGSAWGWLVAYILMAIITGNAVYDRACEAKDAGRYASVAIGAALWPAVIVTSGTLSVYHDSVPWDGCYSDFPTP